MLCRIQVIAAEEKYAPLYVDYLKLLNMFVGHLLIIINKYWSAVHINQAYYAADTMFYVFIISIENQSKGCEILCTPAPNE